jgi:protein SCO1/2
MMRLIGACLLSLLALGSAHAGPWQLPVIKEVADFTLTDQADRPFHLAATRGKVLLVSFVFTTCTGSCPATTQRLSLVSRELDKRGLTRQGNVHLLSISLDAARDTPEVLRKYMQLHEIEPAHWTFVTGAPEALARVHAGWGMWARPTANGQLDHPSRVFLVDARGRLREVYNLDFLRVPWVVEDIERLLQEAR